MSNQIIKVSKESKHFYTYKNSENSPHWYSFLEDQLEKKKEKKRINQENGSVDGSM